MRAALLLLLGCGRAQAVARSFQQVRPITICTSSCILRLLQMNTLADGLFGLREDLGMHARASRAVAHWDSRKLLLLQEIAQYSADVVTLQEVDHYHDWFAPEMRRLGYDGVFAPKPISSCLEVSDSCDGCAIFVKRSRLTVVSSETVTLSLSKAEMRDGGEIAEDSILAQNQVALVLVLEMAARNGNEAPPPIIVATTHLKSSRSATGERYRHKEILQVLGVLDTVRASLASMGRPAAVLLAGDFNAVSDSKLYEPLTYRAIKNHEHLPLRSVYNEDVSFLPHFAIGPDCVPLTFLAVVRRGLREETLKRCIDYIFYSPFKAVQPPTAQAAVRLQRGATADLVITLFVRSLYYCFVCAIASACVFESELSESESLVVLVTLALSLVVFEYTTNQDGTTIILKKGEAMQLLEKDAALPAPPSQQPGFQTLAVLEPFTLQQLGSDLLPSEVYGSDHVAIAADLQLFW